MISQMVRDFAEKEIRPNVMHWDEEQIFPKELFHKMGELGLMGVLVPSAYGGAGLGYYEYISCIVEISKVCGSIGLSVVAQFTLHEPHFRIRKRRAKTKVPSEISLWRMGWCLGINRSEYRFRRHAYEVHRC